MTIHDFFTQCVDGYLFKDLETMSNCVQPEGEEYGAVGYPMILTIFSGMELLGNLLLESPDKFDKRKGQDYFLKYWDNYLLGQNEAYKGMGETLYKLARHGIAHNYVSKYGITVQKGTNLPIQVDKKNRSITIDCNVLFIDFKDSYEKMVKPILNGRSGDYMDKKKNMGTRLQNMLQEYSRDSEKLFEILREQDNIPKRNLNGSGIIEATKKIRSYSTSASATPYIHNI